MPDAKHLIEAYRSADTSAVTSKLSVLIEVERVRTAAALEFLLHVVADKHEPSQVRLHVVAWLGSASLSPAMRPKAADAMLEVLRHDQSFELRLHAANSLAEFADLPCVLATLGAIALNRSESPDLRYGAFISLESAGPTADSVRSLQRMSCDELLGPSARDLLKLWRVRRP